MRTTRLSYVLPLPAFLLFTSLAPAQQNPVIPPEYAKVWGGNNGTGLGLAGANRVMQALYVSPVPVPNILFGIGFRRTLGTKSSTAFSATIEMALSSTTKTLSTLSATYANNPGGDNTVVFKNGTFNVGALPVNVSPAKFVVIPATTPWVYKGPNLLVDFKTFGMTGTGFRMDRCFERTTSGQAMNFGQGCGTATIGGTGSYTAGNSFSITLGGAPANQMTLPVIGLNCADNRGLALPADLGIMGMPKCELLASLDIELGLLRTDASGAASLGSLTVPNVTGIVGLGVAFQWLYADQSAPNSLKALATNGRLIHIGPIICKNRYVYSFSNPATSGFLQAGGPIAQIRTTP